MDNILTTYKLSTDPKKNIKTLIEICNGDIMEYDAAGSIVDKYRKMKKTTETFQQMLADVNAAAERNGFSVETTEDQIIIYLD